MVFEDDSAGQSDIPSADQSAAAQAAPQKDQALVASIIREIKADKQHHKKAFDRMRRDMKVAMWGDDEKWPEDNYRANIAGRHVKQKTAALYAKNPKASAKRREQIDFAIWDENPASLQMAIQTIQMAQMAMAVAQATPPQADPMTGAVVSAPVETPPGFAEAQALVADFQQGYQRRQMFDRIGRTMEILFSHAMSEQQPLDFKRGMKMTVRRAATTGVGYVELGFQRQTGPRPGLAEQLADARARLDHLNRLQAELAEGEVDEDAAERAELEHSLQALQTEPEIILREGLIVDYPQSTKVIPDRMTKSLEGFVGARHVAIEYMYSAEEVREIFGVDIGDGYTSYSSIPGSPQYVSDNDVLDDNYEWSPPTSKRKGMVCVWKYYDKPSGLVYYVADGYAGFLRPPAPPDVFVETFWPVYALTFNAVESEDELFPPSDVSLMLHMQKEYNRSRQGLREHREAARPRWTYANGSFSDEEDPLVLKDLKAFEAAGLNLPPGTKLSDILDVVPTPGVDPNLYETGPIFTDTQLVVGAQEAQFGGVAKATATESAIAANATTASDGSSIDDLDSFLSQIARASGVILLKEMSEETVMRICGPGAMWPQMALSDIVDEIHLEVAAGSTGKPNQAVEINNMQQLLPFLLQMPSINKEELTREVLRRLDDNMDLTKMIVANAPSIVAQNQMTQPAPADPGNAPDAQGGQGAANAPAPPGGPGGSDPAFGSNQVAAPL